MLRRKRMPLSNPNFVTTSGAPVNASKRRIYSRVMNGVKGLMHTMFYMNFVLI